MDNVYNVPAYSYMKATTPAWKLNICAPMYKKPIKYVDNFYIVCDNNLDKIFADLCYFINDSN